MANHDRDRRLNGLNPLAYLGVEPSTPPQMVQNDRRPTPQDYQNFTVGTLWFVRGTDEIWALINKAANIASWTLTMGGNAIEFLADDGNKAIPALSTLSVIGGPNIDTSAVPHSGANLIIGLQDDVNINGNFTVASLVGGDGGVVRCDGSGLLQSSNGTNGQILVGGGTQPTWANLTSSDASIAITNGPNSIDLIAVGGGGAGFAGLIADDTNTATPNVDHKVEVVGGDGLVTVAEPGKLTINLDASTENGQLLIGGGAGVPTIWKRLQSSGGTVSITYPLDNTINLEAVGGGGGGLVSLSGDTGTATPSVGDIKIEGGNLITTSASGSTVTISLDEPSPMAKGKILISSSVGAPQWASITPGTGIGITENENQIIITNTGGGGGGTGVTVFDCISGAATPNPATPEKIFIEGDLDPASSGYNNITTVARTVAGFNDVVEIVLKPRVKLPATNSTAEQGAIWIDSSPALHALGTRNIFVGRGAGNLSLTTGSATDNVGVGASALRVLTTGAKNTCIGQGSGYDLTEGSNNTFVGEDSGVNVSTGSSNVAIGRAALYGETTGSYCVAIGDSALYGDTHNGTIGIGYEAFKAGGDGVAIGYRAGLLCPVSTSGSYVFVGYEAGNSVLGGSGHICIGYGSDVTNTVLSGTQGAAVAIGRFAVVNRVSDTYDNGVAIGIAADATGDSIAIGSSASSTGNVGVVIGREASGSGVIIGSGAEGTGISIGALAKTPSGGVSIAGGTVPANEIYILPSAAKARIGGIYNSASPAGSLPVRVSSTGYLGYGLGAGSVYYMGVYEQDQFNVTGDMTKYYLGTSSTNEWVTKHNIGGGSIGSYGSYYEPNTEGLYHITLTLRLNGLREPLPPAPPPAPPVVYNDPVVIEVYNQTAYNRNYAFYPPLWYNGYQDFMSVSFSTQAYLGTASRIRVYVQFDYRPGRPDSGGVMRYNEMVKCIGIDGNSLSSAEYFTYLAVSLIDPGAPAP